MNNAPRFQTSFLPCRIIRSGVCAIVFALALFSCGCRRKPAAAAVPERNAEAIQFAAEGDAYLRQYHLSGWRQAEALYRKAYDLAGTDEYKEKLLMARLLVLTRQVDEDIPGIEADAVVRDLCAGGESGKASCAVAQWYRTGKADQPPEIGDAPLFRGEDAAIETYLRLLLAGGNLQAETKADSVELTDDFKTTSLFLYLNPGRLNAKDPVEVESSYPKFAEAFEYLGESLFQNRKYGTAKAYFRKALEIIPDYTRAINGLGNIYFFALEDYERALRYYRSALELDPANIAALFGEGAALHKLERYAESNIALDRMLAEGLLQSKRPDPAGYRYYSGEGRYLKAYNYHLMKDSLKARELVDAARRFLPESEEIIELSGLLFFNAGQLEEAQKEFLRIISKGRSNCGAQMHLGLIYRRLKPGDVDSVSENRGAKSYPGYRETWSLRDESGEKKALSYFLGASSCMESGVRNLKAQMESVPSLDLEPNEKTLLQDRLRYKLGDVRATCSSNIELMITEASKDSVSGDDPYLRLMKEILERIRQR